MTSPNVLELAPRARARQSNLAYTLAALPPDRRDDALTFYDFCRAVDDIADEPRFSPAEKHRLLDRWRTALQLGEGLPASLAAVVSRHRIDTRLLLEIVRGVEMDVEPAAFETLSDLREYCWCVACAVGLVSIEIFGCRNPRSKSYAENLGLALQLTNILRDVGEDARLGRLYLPLEELARFGVSEASLRAGKPDGDFLGLATSIAGRAKGYFSAAQATVTAEDARALIPAEAMRLIYKKLLDRMERGGFRVFARRYRVASWEKLAALLTVRFRATRSRVGMI